MFCQNCGKEVSDNAVICVHCGCEVKGKQSVANDGKKSWLVTVLLSWFLGGFGIHRFYTGYIGIGVAQLLTLGGCGIWSLVDFISICFNNFEDSEGNALTGYNKVVGITFFSLVLICTLIYIASVIIAACSGVK